MNFILSSEDYITSAWSGGKTTELFVYPATASFKAQDYDFRLSTATVESNEATFTPLPGVDRTLMVLDGELELAHEGEQTVNLKKFDVAHFKGSLKTSSKGQCVDFNLMLRNGFEGEVNVIKLDGGEHQMHALSDSDMFDFIFLVSGTLTVQTEKEDFFLSESDLLVLETVRKMRFSSVNPVEFLVINVKKVEEEE
jgi:uncharacterized protein